MRAGRWCALLLGVVSPPAVQSQLSGLPQFQQKALLAFSPAGLTPSSLTFNGTIDWVAGSTKESGRVQLKASSDGSTSEDWVLPTQSRALTQSALTGLRNCSYTDPAAKKQKQRDLNCFRVIPWFSPWIAIAPVTAALGTATDSSQSADKTTGLLRVTFTPTPVLDTKGLAPEDLSYLQRATQVVIFYDTATALPRAIEYEQVLDSEPSHSLKYRVVFNDYRIESGFMVPHHLQRYLQRSLQADIHITSVTAE